MRRLAGWLSFATGVSTVLLVACQALLDDGTSAPPAGLGGTKDSAAPDAAGSDSGLGSRANGVVCSNSRLSCPSGQLCCWRADAGAGTCGARDCASDEAAIACTTSLACNTGEVCCVESTRPAMPGDTTYRIRSTCRVSSACDVNVEGILCQSDRDCASVVGRTRCQQTLYSKPLPVALATECYPR